MTSNSTTRQIFFYILLTAVSILTFFIFQPYVITLAVATAFSVVVQPLFQAINRIARGRSSVAALLTIMVTMIVVLAPLTLIGMQLTRESITLYDRFSEETPLDNNTLTTIESTIERYVRAYVPNFDVDLVSIARQGATWISLHVGPLFSNTIQFVLQLFLGIIAFYYLLKDGPDFIKRWMDLSPLKDKHDKKIFDRLNLAIVSIIKGSLLIALGQGIISGIGFAIFGLPSATLWGALAAVGALVPGVGTAVVITPAVIYLFATGNTFGAIGLTIWGSTAVGLLDNFLGPALVGRGVRIHPLFILFAVIGGLQFYGPMGFILGPLTLSLLYALLDIYQIIASDKNTQTL
jgi:predicted PurR-regulated permease PerM